MAGTGTFATASTGRLPGARRRTNQAPGGRAARSPFESLQQGLKDLIAMCVANPTFYGVCAQLRQHCAELPWEQKVGFAVRAAVTIVFEKIARR